MTDVVEFYEDGTKKRFAHVESSMVPAVGSFVNIRRQTWRVNQVTYALDYADAKFDQPRMRAIVDLKRRKDLDP